MKIILYNIACHLPDLCTTLAATLALFALLLVLLHIQQEIEIACQLVLISLHVMCVAM